MRIAIIGDTHARVAGVSRVLAKNRPDHIIHAGDFYADARRIAEPLNIPFDAVTGNCDAQKGQPAELLLELAGQRIYVIHGHQYGVKRDLNNLYYRAREMAAGIAVFGHTHVPYCEKVKGLWLLNPGSASRPRLSKSGTYIWLTIEEQRVTPEICKIKL
ncbi:MAG: metallophosphoesterase family protein [Syntrophomonadaceae bacterium]